MNSSKENDVFNKVMLMPILKSMLIFCKKHKEIFMYLFFGGLGVSINIILFAVIDKCNLLDCLCYVSILYE